MSGIFSMYSDYFNWKSDHHNIMLKAAVSLLHYSTPKQSCHYHNKSKEKRPAIYTYRLFRYILQASKNYWLIKYIFHIDLLFIKHCIIFPRDCQTLNHDSVFQVKWCRFIFPVYWAWIVCLLFFLPSQTRRLFTGRT